MALTITEVRFYGQRNENFLSYVNVVLDAQVVLRSMRLVHSKHDPKKLILSMPAKKSNQGDWIQLYSPINRRMRMALEIAVFGAWNQRQLDGVE